MTGNDMTLIAQATFSAIVSCFRNVIEASRTAGNIPKLGCPDEWWIDTFKTASLEPDFEKFVEGMPLNVSDSPLLIGKARKAYKIGWLLARTFEDNFVPVNSNSELQTTGGPSLS